MEDYKSCFGCKFHDGTCCMYDCAVLATLNEEEMAKNCNHYAKGKFDYVELEKTNYK